jgi:adenosylhomocysteine nucleosidase
MTAVVFSRHGKLSAMVALSILLLFLFINCGEAPRKVQPYVILYAFDAEGELLADKMAVDTTEKVLGRVVHIGELSGKDIVLAESGVGMTNAAMTAQKLIDKYNPKAVIFSGIAGAIDTSVHIGDIAVSDRWATHDYGYYGAEGFKIGSIEVYPAGSDSVAGILYFEADSALFETARELKSANFAFDSIGIRVPRLFVGGAGTSGNSFIDQVEKRLWLSENFEALTVDMESAAVAQVCTVNGVPFIIFRSASDLAGGSGSESARMEIREFFKVAANNSAQVVVKFLELL